MKKHARHITVPRYAATKIVPRNPAEALWFFILDLLGKAHIMEQ